MPPWLKMRSTRAETASTQYTALINLFRFLNCSLEIMSFRVAFGDAVADSRYECNVQCIGVACTVTVDGMRLT